MGNFICCHIFVMMSLAMFATAKRSSWENIFHIFQRKCMLWILIRSTIKFWDASKEYLQHIFLTNVVVFNQQRVFLWRNKKNYWRKKSYLEKLNLFSVYIIWNYNSLFEFLQLFRINNRCIEELWHIPDRSGLNSQLDTIYCHTERCMYKNTLDSKSIKTY